MLWELLTYVILPLTVLVIIRRRRARRFSRDVRVTKGFSSDVVLITGGAQGIGKQLAYKFGERGAKLVLWDINEAKLQSTRKELEDTGYDAFAYTVNCGNKESVLAAAAKVKEEIGDVTVLVNNAGTYSGKLILQMEDDDMENTMKVNVLAHFWVRNLYHSYIAPRIHRSASQYFQVAWLLENILRRNTIVQRKFPSIRCKLSQYSPTLAGAKMKT